MANSKHGLMATRCAWQARVLAGLLLVAAVEQSARAVDYYFTNTTGSAQTWNGANAWGPTAGAPGAGDTVHVGINTAGQVNLSVSANDLTALIVTNLANTFTINFNVSGTSVLITNQVSIGAAGNAGTLRLQGSSTTAGQFLVTNAMGTAQMIVGDSANGTFFLGGATANPMRMVVDQLIVGNSAGVSGTYNSPIQRGSLIASNIVVGAGGTGVYTVSGLNVTNLVLGGFVIGRDAGSTGSVTISTASSILMAVTNASGNAQLIVGQNGAGNLTLSAGALQVDQLIIATNAGSAGTFTWNAGAELTIKSLGGDSNNGMAIFTNFIAPRTAAPTHWGSNSTQALIFNTNIVGTANFYHGLVLGAQGTGVVSFGQSGVAGSANLFVTNAAGNAQLIVGQAGVGSFTLNAGSLTVNRLLATNVTGRGGAGYYTNSLVALGSGSTLTTSNAATGVAAHIVIASNAAFNINGRWNMRGGTNLIHTVSTDPANVGTVYVGNAVSDASVTVGRNAVWTLGTNGGVFMDLTIGNGTGGNDNSLIITNGGQVFSGNGTVGGAGRTNNQAWVTGSGSIWSNAGALAVGSGALAFGNQLTIANSGRVYSATGFVGGPPTVTVTTAPNISSNTVLITDTGSLWIVTGDLMVGRSPPNAGVTGLGGNQVIVSNGAALVSGSAYIGGGPFVRGASNNLVIVTGAGSVWTNLDILRIGAGSTTIGLDNGSNGVIVSAGGEIYNTGEIQVGVFKAPGSYLRVSGTGSVVTATGTLRLGVNLHSPFSSVLVTDGGRLISGAGTLAANQNTSNAWVTIADPGSVWDLNGNALFVGGNNTGANDATVTISNGATLLSGNLTVGNQGSGHRYNAGGLGAVSYSTNAAILVGNTARFDNTLTITNANVQATSLTVGGISFSSNNTAIIVAGGLLEANTLATAINGAGNTITNRGGVFQFTSTTILVTTNGGIGSIAIDNGTISFRDVTVNLTNNWRGSGLTNMAWVGNNTLRLNNATATNTLAGGYSFNPNVGPTNYARLEMINGTTAVTGNGITVETGGTMLVSNTTATVAGVFTNAGSLSFVNARATFQSRVYNSGTSTMLNTFATFAGGVVNAGHWATDPTTNVFASFGLTNTVSGGITMAAGDVYVFTNTAAGTPANFINVSTNHLATDLTAGKFLFSGGLGLTQTLTVAGHDLGPAAATATNLAIASSSAPGYVNNFALGTLEVSNFSTVRVTDAFLELGTNDFLMAGLYLENLFLGENSLLIIATNVQVYFKNSNNWSLVNIRLENNQSSLFGGDAYDYNNAISGLHQLVVVPEPSVLLLLLGGCATLWLTRRRQRSSRQVPR